MIHTTTPKHPDFAARLGAALDHRRITDPRERVKTVAEGAWVTPRTAKRYLAGESRPDRELSVLHLCDHLQIHSGWLLGDKAFKRVEEAELVFFFRRLPEREQGQFYKFMVLMKENNERTYELSGQLQRHEIDRAEFLDLVEAEYIRQYPILN